MREKIGDVTVHLSLNGRPLKNGKFPVYIRVQHGSENRYYSTKCEMSELEWKTFERLPENDHPAMLRFKATVQSIDKLVRLDDFSFNNLSQNLKVGNGPSIQSLFREKEESLKAKNKWNTANVYHNTNVFVTEFLNGRETPVYKFSPDRCREFMQWLKDEKKNGPTTISIKMRSLNAVLNMAVQRRLIASNPMLGIKKPVSPRREMDVENESLRKLLLCTEEDLGKEYKWIHWFRAIYYGNGLNVRDLIRLRQENISPNGKEIIFTRHKTEDSSGKRIRIPIIPELRQAISSLPQGEEHLLSILDGYEEESLTEHHRIRRTVKNIDDHFREITRILEIPEKITTYNARHCFATTLLRNKVPIEFISEAMGHTSIRTTQHYLEGYTQEQRKEAARTLVPE